jgi:transposase InsO family protein
MSRTGCCYDNAPMESFFHTLKVELVHQQRWGTRECSPQAYMRGRGAAQGGAA